MRTSRPCSPVCAAPMFERAHHRRVEQALQALDGDLLATHACWFGGGTAMALRFGEYRESVDIDLLTADPEGFRFLREQLTGPAGVQALARDGAFLAQARPVRADAYGLRTQLLVDGVAIKFEIVREARIPLDRPGPKDRVAGIATLKLVDLLAEKLLANADRWADSSTFARDLIDLAMVDPPRPTLQAALVKARTAYGEGVDRALRQAHERLSSQPERLRESLRALQMVGTTPAQLLQNLKTLARRAAPH